jgi:hypothetical protein
VRDALDYLVRAFGLGVPEKIRARLHEITPSATDVRSYDLLTLGHESWGLADVVATRWDEFTAAGDRARWLKFPGYFIEANAHYRKRRLTAADVWSRLTANWRRLRGR